MDIRTFLSISPLALVARHWAVVNRVRAAWYARPRTAAINGVQPSVSLKRGETSMLESAMFLLAY